MIALLLDLSSQGADVVIAEDGAQAVAAFEVDDFDLILMDMQMPVMDGLTAIRLIREREAAAPGRGRIPIIMLSANAMTEHRDDAIAAGADAHVAKPITAASLLAGIEAVLD